MRWLKKYVSILFLLLVFPLAWYAGKSFITERGTDIYEYIPQESDIVIEVNNVNFISEFAYQRVFNEKYVLEKIDFEEAEVETGIDYFSKVILFREQWAQEYVWFAVIAYTDRQKLTTYVQTKLKGSHMAFGKDYCIVQLSQSVNQEEMDNRLKQIAGKDIKPFTSRVNLRKYFQADKEINCYFIPPTGQYENQLIDGYLNFDFLGDHVDITGEFTPVSGVDGIPSIAYAINEESSFSLRSSLNIFNSIYWFSNEKITNVPEYSQMAVDYEGVNMFLADGSIAYAFPFKKFPNMQVKFDLIDKDKWQGFYDTLLTNGTIRVDTTTSTMATKDGTFVKYNFTDKVFEMGKNKSHDFALLGESEICFDLQFKIKQLLDNTKFAVDEDNPPGDFLQGVILGIAQEQVEELRVLQNIEQITFQLRKDGSENIEAEGHLLMSDPNGNSVIESIIFAQESVYFISQFLEIVSDMN